MTQRSFDSAASPPRLLPARPLPPYTYVPGGKFPHPVRHPQGHSYRAEAAPAAIESPERWHRCDAYLRGIDLFNRGYYWEAHESWEAVWHAVGRGGTVGDFCKALIRLAAVGVKAREGRPAGVRRHAQRARQLLESVAAHRLAHTREPLMGLRPWQLAEEAGRIGEAPHKIIDRSGAPVVVVMPFALRAGEIPSEP